MIRSLESLWKQLAADDSQPTGYMRLRVEPSSPCGLFAAVEKPANRKAILLEVDSQAISPHLIYPESVGFDVLPTPIEPGPHGKVRIALVVSTPSFDDVFAVLALDVITQVAAAHDQKSGVKEFVARLNRWQAFLRKHSPEGLSEIEQQGLYGELWFLRQCLAASACPREIVASWAGPLKANQDFRLARCAVEVKTTSGAPPHSVQIANVRQLDDTGIAHLFLFHLSFDVRPGSTQTLAELVDIIRSILSSSKTDALAVFNDRLIDAGYLDAHGTRYCQMKFTLRNQCYFEVRDGFPRLLERDIPSGVGDVSYSLSLDACLPFVASEETIMDHVKEGSNGRGSGS